MKILLDTHVYLWCVNDNRLLSKSARKIISDATEVYVSTASIWEAAIKIKLKKLEADLNALIDAISESGFLELPILTKHIMGINQLPDFHRDPFDRILVAQAINEPLRLLTCDSILREYSELVHII
jgi:PIN domain nuclease of toxin-antitoxin system